jgi:hypothetical protein
MQITMACAEYQEFGSHYDIYILIFKGYLNTRSLTLTIVMTHEIPLWNVWIVAAQSIVDMVWSSSGATVTTINLGKYDYRLC